MFHGLIRLFLFIFLALAPIFAIDNFSENPQQQEKSYLLEHPSPKTLKEMKCFVAEDGKIIQKLSGSFNGLNIDILTHLCTQFLNVKEFTKFSLTCRNMYSVIRNNILLKTKVDLMSINLCLKNRIEKYTLLLDSPEQNIWSFPETVRADINTIASLKKEQDTKTQFLLQFQKQKNTGEDFEEVPLEDVLNSSQTLDKNFNLIIPNLLKYSEENPPLCSSCFELPEHMRFLAEQVNHNLTPHLLNFKRLFNMISRNRPLIIGGTAVSVTAFFIGVYYFYNQYPWGVLEEFMKKTTFSQTEFFRGGSEEFFTNWPRWPTGYWNTPSPGYNRFADGPVFNEDNKNFSHLINYIQSGTNCPLAFITDKIHQAMAFNGSNINPSVFDCVPRDNTSLCCMNAWPSNTTFGTPTCFMELDYKHHYCMQLVIGNGMEALTTAISTWQWNMGWYCGLVAPLTLTWIWMMLISYFCC